MVGSRTQFRNLYQLNSLLIAAASGALLALGLSALGAAWQVWAVGGSLPVVAMVTVMVASWRCLVLVSDDEVRIRHRVGETRIERRAIAKFAVVMDDDWITALISIGDMSLQPELRCVEVQFANGRIERFRANAGLQRHVDRTVKRLNLWLRHGIAAAAGPLPTQPGRHAS